MTDDSLTDACDDDADDDDEIALYKSARRCVFGVTILYCRTACCCYTSDDGEAGLTKPP